MHGEHPCASGSIRASLVSLFSLSGCRIVRRPSDTLVARVFMLTPEGFNREPLNADFQVHWLIHGASLNVELIHQSVYMSFGVSGSDVETDMIGADTVVADFFN